MRLPQVVVDVGVIAVVVLGTLVFVFFNLITAKR